MEQLSEYFNHFIDTPNGIKKLRELILTIAMQGKLVNQDQNDHPASELIAEIEKEKNRLIADGKIKNTKTLPEISDDEVPYELPAGWEWARLSQIGQINPKNESADDVEAGFVPMSLIADGVANKHAHDVRTWKEIKKGYTHIADGDIGLAKITPCFENRKSCVFSGLPNGIGAGTTELHIYRNILPNVLDAIYLLYYLKNPSFIEGGKSNMTGTAGQQRVPRTYFADRPFPLPPLNEQTRIVKKIDSLMALCDQLEALRNERNAKRLETHASAIHHLIESGNTGEFRTSWKFITDHFSLMYSVKENVEELKKAILTLAMQGKLVKQDPNDQPASKLIAEIEKEKKRLIAEGKIKKAKPLPEIGEDELPYELPAGWEWVRLGDVGIIGSSSRVHQRDWKNSGVPFYRAREIVKLHKNGVVENDLFISEDLYQELIKKGNFPEKGDILLTGVGTIGIPYIVQNEDRFYFKDATVLIFKNFFNLNPEFLKRFFLSPFFIESIHSQSMGTTVHTLTISRASNQLVALPPDDEQARIVRKIDSLMSLCDSLIERIEEQNGKSEQLVSAVLAGV
jgi:type I restriction enzyme S subunit